MSMNFDKVTKTNVLFKIEHSKKSGGNKNEKNKMTVYSQIRVNPDPDPLPFQINNRHK